MRFHLTYAGPLHGSNTGSPRARHKHEIRKVFHRQLKRLWDKSWLNTAKFFDMSNMVGLAGMPETALPDVSKPLRESLASLYKRGAYSYVPLVRQSAALHCGIDVLFLRPDVPGGIIQSADIDNRLKTLFDALRLPTHEAELGGYETPDTDEAPFYCLLEDDKLVSHVSVSTDVLLEPVEDQINDARLFLDIKITPYAVNLENLSYAGS
jgi:hypothetical protein